MGKNKTNTLVAFLATSFVLGLIAPAFALAASPPAVNLGMAGSFTILAKTGVSTTGPTSVVGNVGLSPAAATYITGFGLILPYYGSYSSSALVTGNVYASDYAAPTPSNLTSAVLDMQNAYTDAMGRAPDVTELGAGNIGGMTLAPGAYKWSTGLTIPTSVTLSGGASDIWIFQVAQNLNISSATNVILSGGAQAGNIYWVVAGQTTIGTTAVFNGNILDQTAIVLNTGARLNGRALAQSAVTLDSNTVTAPTYVALATPATPATPATSTPGTGTPATPVTPATPATPASPDNAALKLQLDGLLATLRSLQARAGQSGSAAPSNFGQAVKVLVADLKLGSASADVKALQQFLIEQGKGPAAKILGNNGATLHFGALTRAALAEFQTSVGITPATGYFGAKTRSYIRSNY